MAASRHQAAHENHKSTLLTHPYRSYPKTSAHINRHRWGWERGSPVPRMAAPASWWRRRWRGGEPAEQWPRRLGRAGRGSNGCGERLGLERRPGGGAATPWEVAARGAGGRRSAAALPCRNSSERMEGGRWHEQQAPLDSILTAQMAFSYHQGLTADSQCNHPWPPRDRDMSRTQRDREFSLETRADCPLPFAVSFLIIINEFMPVLLHRSAYTCPQAAAGKSSFRT